MNQEQLNELHNVQMEIMDEIHSVCTKNGLRYYLIAGSAIGIVRHKGFIPWDVDIDIAMPRSDYMRLIEKHSSELSSRFSLHYYKTDDGFDSPHALVVHNGSVVKFKDTAYKRYGIFIDVFPLDTCPDNEDLRNRQAKALSCISRIVSLKLHGKGRNIIYTLRRKLAQLVLFPLSENILNRIRDRIMRKYEKFESEAECWCSMGSKYSYARQCMPKEYYGTPVLYQFEDRNYFGPEQIEKHLDHLYGNYMSLPDKGNILKQMNSIVYASWKDSDGNVIEIGEV